MRFHPIIRYWLGSSVVALTVLYAVAVGMTGAPSLDHPALAQSAATLPLNVRPQPGSADTWRLIRRGIRGKVSILDKKAGVLIQSEGEDWRSVRDGPLTVYGVWLLVAVVGALALFLALRGRIRIESGFAGTRVERFKSVERFAHWLTASTFVVLALTGLNMLYGRYVLKPLIGPEAFSIVTRIGKYAHDFLSFAFMAGLVLIFVLWVRDNIPKRYDLIWLAKGGGLFSRGTHPPAGKFNAGQKLLFWLVVLLGGSLSVTGFFLLLPFHYAAWGPTFGVIDLFGFDLPTKLQPLQEMQLTQLWHAIVALVMMALIIAHIYIGTLGMEGAFDAMGSGLVDENWARAHHRLWMDDIKGVAAAPKGGGGASKNT